MSVISYSLPAKSEEEEKQIIYVAMKPILERKSNPGAVLVHVFAATV